MTKPQTDVASPMGAGRELTHKGTELGQKILDIFDHHNIDVHEHVVQELYDLATQLAERTMTKTPPPQTEQTIEEQLKNKDSDIYELFAGYSNYLWDYYHGRRGTTPEDCQKEAKELIAKVLTASNRELLERVIKYIRSGAVAGSFSEGCDCAKCDKYEKRVRAELKRLGES